MKKLLFEGGCFNFRYNEFEKPSSKSYMAPCIKDVDIEKYCRYSLDDDKTEYLVYCYSDQELSEIAQEQLKLFFINLDNISEYSKVILNIIYIK